MPHHPLTDEARHENALTLAQTLGIEIGAAAQALDLSILITADPADEVAQAIAAELVSLLGRTVRCALAGEGASGVAAEVVIGAQTPRTVGTRIYVQVSVDGLIISESRRATHLCAKVPGILCVLIACYVSAAAIQAALGKALPFTVPDPFIVNFDQFGVTPGLLATPINLDGAYLVGAGAIGNGFLWAARHLDLRGRLAVVDDDRVGSGNLNRQIWFETDDINEQKADRLVARAQPFFTRLVLEPRNSRLQAVKEKSDGPWLKTLIVAVDSRRARRALQNECPREVLDASTTDIREVVIHSHTQPTTGACLSCIYEPDAEESSREQHIAEHLGVSLAEVRSERVSAAGAQIIAARFPKLSAIDLEGTAYDTLFKRLCGEGALTTLEGQRLLAPFAFVSVLAGALLALELVRRRTIGSQVQDNYWRISPWHPPLSRRRVRRPQQPACGFCANPILRKVNEWMWGAR